MKSPSTTGAILNIEDAMELVEQAQGLLDRAAQKLSPIRRGNDLYDQVFAQREAVHQFWYRLSTARDRNGMSLDSEPEVK